MYLLLAFGLDALAMTAPQSQSHPSAARAGRTLRRASNRLDQRPSNDRQLDDDALLALADESSGRDVALLALSNARFDDALSSDPRDAETRVAAYESAYLALAAAAGFACAHEDTHPSRRICARAFHGLRLIPCDVQVTMQLTDVYGHGGWENLDLEAVMEWCSRVRLAVARCVA